MACDSDDVVHQTIRDFTLDGTNPIATVSDLAWAIQSDANAVSALGGEWPGPVNAAVRMALLRIARGTLLQAMDNAMVSHIATWYARRVVTRAWVDAGLPVTLEPIAPGDMVAHAFTSGADVTTPLGFDAKGEVVVVALGGD